MSLVIAIIQELNSSCNPRDWSIVVLIQQTGRADALRIAWNGKALSRPAVACNTKTFNLPQRRGVAEVYFGLHAGAALAANSVSCIRVVVRG